jgi:hypothetical protein
MKSPAKIALTVIAERDTDFFMSVAARLKSAQYDVCFIVFYEPACKKLSAAGFEVFNLRDSLKSPTLKKSLEFVGQCETEFNLSIRDILLHERLTFNRHDEDRLAVKAVSYLYAINEILELAKADVVVQELGGFIAPLALFYACRSKKVRHLFIEPMLFKGTVGFVENSINFEIPIDALSDEFEEKVASYLRRYNQQHTVVIPNKDRHHYMDATLRKLVNKENLVRLYGKLLHKYIRRNHQEYDAILNHVLRYMGMVINRSLLSSSYQRSYGSVAKKRYVYFPLHVPIDFQLTVRAPEWIDQLSLLEYIADLLPYGVELWTKEHPAMIGSYSYSALGRLLRRSNFRLIHPSENSYDLVRGASAVITINSKVGAEALMQSKAVFVLGNPFYSRQGISIDVSSLVDLKTKLTTYLKSGSSQALFPDQERIRGFLRCVMRYSLAGELYLNEPGNISRFTDSMILALEGRLALSGGVQ